MSRGNPFICPLNSARNFIFLEPSWSNAKFLFPDSLHCQVPGERGAGKMHKCHNAASSNSSSYSRSSCVALLHKFPFRRCCLSWRWSCSISRCLLLDKGVASSLRLDGNFAEATSGPLRNYIHGVRDGLKTKCINVSDHTILRASLSQKRDGVREKSPVENS